MITLPAWGQKGVNKLLARWYNFRKISYIPLLELVIQEYYDSKESKGKKRELLFFRPYLAYKFGEEREFTYEEVRRSILEDVYSRDLIVNWKALEKLLEKRVKNPAVFSDCSWNPLKKLCPKYPILLRPIPTKNNLEEYL